MSALGLLGFRVVAVAIVLELDGAAAARRVGAGGDVGGRAEAAARHDAVVAEAVLLGAGVRVVLGAALVGKHERRAEDAGAALALAAGAAGVGDGCVVAGECNGSLARLVTRVALLERRWLRRGQSEEEGENRGLVHDDVVAIQNAGVEIDLKHFGSSKQAKYLYLFALARPS